MTIVSAPEELRDQVRNLTRMQLIRTCAAWRPDTSDAADPASATRIALTSLARRMLELSDETAMLDELIAPIVTGLAPQLLDRPGIGVEIAGQLLVTAADNRDRLRSEASFAMLCGVAPLPASSGMTQRHRLNHGGDRQANSALHLAVNSRLRIDPAIQAPVARKTAEGHSKLEIIRCLKRYLAREVYYLLNPGKPASNATPKKAPWLLDEQESIHGWSISSRLPAAEAIACRSPASELTTRSRRRRAPSTTHASTTSLVWARAADAPAERALPSSSTSTLQPASSRAS
jgi:Transposase IS116/IS110/IS902 family